MTDVFDLRAEVAGMPTAEALSYVLEYLDYLFPADDLWRVQGVPLQKLEARLLRRLWMRQGYTVPRAHLMAAMYGDRQPCEWPEANLLAVYACQLRPKIAPLGGKIVVDWGVGYALHMPPGVDIPWQGVEHRPGRPRKVAA